VRRAVATISQNWQGEIFGKITKGLELKIWRYNALLKKYFFRTQNMALLNNV